VSRVTGIIVRVDVIIIIVIMDINDCNYAIANVNGYKQ
jgi:hypothetical protein